MARQGQTDVYQTHVEPHLEEIKEWYQIMSLQQIADALGVAKSTLCKYKKQHPELAAALTDGKKKLVIELRSAMKKRALGYNVEETTTKETWSDEKGYTKVVTTSMRHIPPDLGSQCALLKNIDPDWHDADHATLKHRERELDIKQQKADAAEW